MKSLPLILGLMLLTAPAELGATPPKSAVLSTAERSELAAMSSRGSSPASPGPWAIFVPPDDLNSVEIVSVSEAPPEADGRRRVTVRIKHTLSSQPKAILCLGFNVNSSAKFSMLSDRWVQAGSAVTELSATIAPVTWPDKRPLKAFVSLSAQPQPKQWSMLASDARVLKLAPATVAAR